MMFKPITFPAHAAFMERRHLRFDATQSWSPRIFAAGLRCIDVLFALTASWGLAAAFAHEMPPGQTLYAEFTLAAFLTCEAMWLIGGGSPATTQDRRDSPIVASVLIGAAVLIGCLALQQTPLHRSLLLSLSWGLAMVMMLFIARVSCSQLLQRARNSGRLVNKVAILGEGARAQALMKRLLMEDPALVRLAGCYRIDAVAADDQDGPATRGDLPTLLLDCRLGGIDSIVLATPPADAQARERLEAALTSFAVDLYILPEDIELAGADARPGVLGRQSLLLVSERPLKDWKWITKGLFDRCCALAILVGVAPILCIVAILVRLDSPGTILFRQLRVGYNNRPFHVLKFRTMYSHAADRLATVQTTRNDPRVTRLGRVLRRLSLDELPQLFNVLDGSMSLVGPRPHAPGTSAAGQRVEFLVDNYARRHLVKPGITGLAQVRGLRGGMTTREQVADRVRCDLEYIRRQSLWLDVKILVMTAVREVRTGSAC